MAKIMRFLVFLGAATTAIAQDVDMAQCAVNGAQAVDQMADAAVFIWAATNRCNKGAAGSPVKCVVDIASAAQSVNDMINVIVGAVENCGAIKANANGCGNAVSQLTSATAGLAAASAGIVDNCPKQEAHGGPEIGFSNIRSTNTGQCVIDAKSAVGSLFSAAKNINDAKQDCAEDAATCTSSVFNVLAGLADLGSFLAASANDCTSIHGDGNDPAGCVSAGLALVSSLQGVAASGKAVSDECSADASRLFLEAPKVAATETSFPNLALAACLPVAAVLSFALGRRTRKGYVQASGRDIEQEQVQLVDDE